MPKAIGLWALILALAIANGGLREVVLLPRLGNPAAQWLSGVLLMACIGVVSYFLVPSLGTTSRAQRAGVGLLWFALTLAFEFDFGRLVRGKSWADLPAAYSFEGGNLWPMVRLVTLLAPVWAGSVRAARHPAPRR